MTRAVYIYALKEKGRNEIRYVGQSVDPDMRLLQHLYGTDGLSALNPRKVWIETCRINQIEVEMVILEKCSVVDSTEREKYWIEHYESNGHALTNVMMRPLPTRANTDYIRRQTPVTAKINKPLPTTTTIQSYWCDDEDISSEDLDRIEASLARLENTISVLSDAVSRYVERRRSK